MQIGGIKFSFPAPLKIFSLAMACFVVFGMIYGVGTSVDDGTIKNKPELLRHLVFWSFSFALAYKFAATFCSSENKFAKKLLVAFVFYVPIGLSLALAGGLIGRSFMADVPPATDEFRAQVTEANLDVCIKAIRNESDLKNTYSQKTIETYCICRQRYRADVLAQSPKGSENTENVLNQAADYAHKKCAYILWNNDRN